MSDSSVGIPSSGWNDPTAVDTSNDTRATANVGNSSGPATESQYLKLTNFGFSVPAGSRIDGILVEVERQKLNNGESLRDKKVRIVKGGQVGSTDRADTVTDWPGADNYKPYGGPTDKWGQSWTAADINSSGFGFAISAVGPDSGSQTAAIDHIRVSVFYTRMQCSDGIDNDGDGKTDYPADPGCVDPTDNNEIDPLPACSDGADNDGDGLTDFPADPGCSGPDDNDETNALRQCSDGADNDGDGLTDFPLDPGCEGPADDDEQNFDIIWSNSCVSPDARTVFDGYSGATFAKLITDQPLSGAAGASICYRINEGSFAPGGRLELAAGLDTPTIDDQWDACSGQTDNLIPGSHPVAENEGVAGHQLVDAYANSGGDVWLCLLATPAVAHRVVAKLPSGSDVPRNLPDSPPAPADPETPAVAGLPSSTCQLGSGNVRGLNATIGGAHVWQYGWRESASKVHVCARAQDRVENPTEGGGVRVTVDATGAPGVEPVLEVGFDPTPPCTELVNRLTVQGVTVEITSTPQGQNPASVCVSSTQLAQPVVVTGGFTGDLNPPEVTVTPDPDTPALSPPSLPL